MDKTRHIFVLLAFLLTGSAFIPCVSAEEASPGPAAKFFTDMPLSVMEMISRSKRMDMLDYYEADSIYHAPNGMEGFSYLEKVTPTYLKLSLTPVSTMSVAVLPLKNDTIYQCIYTLGSDTQAHDSEIKFYDKNYNDLNTKIYIALPGLKSFVDASSKKKKGDIAMIEQAIPFPTITYSFDPETSILTARLTSEELIGKEGYNKVSGFLKTEICYIWNGKRYELQKSLK